MVLFVLRKLIFQTCMHSLPMGLDVWFLVGPFVYFHTLCVRTAKSLVRLRECAGSPEPSLVTYVIRTIISWAGSNNKAVLQLVLFKGAGGLLAFSSLSCDLFDLSLPCLYLYIKQYILLPVDWFWILRFQMTKICYIHLRQNRYLLDETQWQSSMCSVLNEQD